MAKYKFQVAAIFKTKMAAKNSTYQFASIKISVEQDLNYLCAKIYNFIQKCTLKTYELNTISPHIIEFSYCHNTVKQNVIYRQVLSYFYIIIAYCTKLISYLNTITPYSEIIVSYCDSIIYCQIVTF